MSTAEAGVSRTTGNNWSRGYKTYRHGQVAGFVPARERLAVRQASARYLSQDERIEMADPWHAGLSIRRIADQLGRAPSTVSRELRRNATAGGYRPFEAHRRAAARRARGHRRRIEANGEPRHLVVEFLAQRWSPRRISRQPRLRFPGEPGMWLCPESIYQAVYQPGPPQRPSLLAPRSHPDLRGPGHHRDGLRITAYAAEPGTPSQDALHLLASWAATIDHDVTANTADRG